MSQAALSIFVFGCYALLTGLLLLLVPDVLLGLFGLPATSEVWVRVVGVVATPLGGYYIQAARHELTPFMRASIPCRGFAVIATCALAVLWSMPVLFLFAAIEMSGLLWTAVALRRH